MSNLTATAYLDLNIEATAELDLELEALVYITSDTPITPPEVLIDSLDGGTPYDITYLPINAQNLTGLSGGQP